MNNNITDGAFDIVFHEQLLNNYIVVDIQGKKTLILKPRQAIRVEFTDESFDLFFEIHSTKTDKETLRALLKHALSFLNEFWSWQADKQDNFIVLMRGCLDSPDKSVRGRSQGFLQLAQMGLRLQAELVGAN
ncbi:MAG TPA: hypothetical protein VGD31_00770 [Sphingobacteriaceae bacterium]